VSEDWRANLWTLRPVWHLPGGRLQGRFANRPYDGGSPLARAWVAAGCSVAAWRSQQGMASNTTSTHHSSLSRGVCQETGSLSCVSVWSCSGEFTSPLSNSVAGVRLWRVDSYTVCPMVQKHSKSAPFICMMDLNGFAVVMATVVFVLMVAFMSWQTPHGGLGVELPRAHHWVRMPRANTVNAVVINITRDCKVYLGADPVPQDEIPTTIRKRLTGGAERKVYLKVDRNAQYGIVMAVLNEVRSAGVEKIGFLVWEVPPAQSLGN